MKEEMLKFIESHWVNGRDEDIIRCFINDFFDLNQTEPLNKRPVGELIKEAKEKRNRGESPWNESKCDDGNHDWVQITLSDNKDCRVCGACKSIDI
jgi:hypothetical protein